jgi:hypothetical protein
LADHASDGDEDLVEVFVALSFDSDNPLLAVVVEKNFLNRCVESKVWLEIEIFGIACEIIVYLSSGGIRWNGCLDVSLCGLRTDMYEHKQSGYGKSVKQPYFASISDLVPQEKDVVHTLSFEMFTTVVLNTDKRSSSEYFHSPPI